jgi:hypothetical protein
MQGSSPERQIKEHVAKLQKAYDSIAEAVGADSQLAAGLWAELSAAKEEARQRIPVNEKRRMVQAALTRVDKALHRVHTEYDEIELEMARIKLRQEELFTKLDGVREKGRILAAEKMVYQQELASFCMAEAGVGAVIPAAIGEIESIKNPEMRTRCQQMLEGLLAMVQAATAQGAAAGENMVTRVSTAGARALVEQMQSAASGGLAAGPKEGDRITLPDGSVLLVTDEPPSASAPGAGVKERGEAQVQEEMGTSDADDAETGFEENELAVDGGGFIPYLGSRRRARSEARAGRSRSPTDMETVEARRKVLRQFGRGAEKGGAGGGKGLATPIASPACVGADLEGVKSEGANGSCG